MESKPMTWADLRERVGRILPGSQLLADIDAAAPAMESAGEMRIVAFASNAEDRFGLTH
jgi:hypothetical protein